MSRAARLIGRESVLAAAGSVLDDARHGAGQFLMISGEAGIGKTAMLAALIGQAGPAPLVLRGLCWEGDGAPPYWPWSQVLQASGLPAADLGEAGWLLQPASGPAEPMSAAAAGDAQFRLFEAVARCLGRLAAGRPCARGARRPALGRRAVAAAAGIPGPRPGRGARGPARRLPGHRGVPGSCTRSPGRPSNSPWPASPRTTSGRWPGSWPGRPFRPRSPPSCGERSGGNPFFVRELIRLLARAGLVAPASPDPGQRRGDAAAQAGPALHGMRPAAGVGGHRGPRHRRRTAGARGRGRP